MTRRALVLAALLLGLVLAAPSPALATPGNYPWLPFLPTKVMQRVMQQGFITYRLDQDAGLYPNFRDQARQVADAGFAALGIPAYETSGQPDVWLTMPDDKTFLGTCGDGAAGCVTYTTDPVIVYFRRALLYADWRTTIAHEGINYGHVMGENEQYDVSAFRCRGVSELLNEGPGLTVMSCGTGIWEPQPFDVQTVAAVMFPLRAAGGAYDPGRGVLWYGPSDSETTRKAVFLRIYSGFTFLYGYAQPCFTQAIVCGAFPLPLGPCVAVIFADENALPGSWGRNDIEVGGTSCF